MPVAGPASRAAAEFKRTEKPHPSSLPYNLPFEPELKSKKKVLLIIIPELQVHIEFILGRL